MPDLRLTEHRIRELPVPTEKEYERYWDTDVTGLCVKVLRSGKTVYNFKARLNGKPIWGKNLPRCSETTLTEMRNDALEWKAMIRKGENPWKIEEREECPTVYELCCENLEEKRKVSGRRKLAPRTLREYEKITNAIKALKIAKDCICDVTVVKAHRQLAPFRDRPRQYDHFRFWLSNSFDYAIKRGYLPINGNPWKYVDKEYELPQADELPRFTDLEIAIIADYLRRAERDELHRSVNSNWVRFIWFLIRTGMRPGDAIKIECSWIKESNGVCFIVHPDTKTGEKRIILPKAIEIPSASMYLFPGRGNSHMRDYRHEFDLLRDATGLDKPPYAIRRWFASVGRRTFDGDIGPVQQLVGWESEEMALRYAGDDEELLENVILDNAKISRAVSRAVDQIVNSSYQIATARNRNIPKETQGNG